tara:strand:- start:47 stop:784 length:738 start_codon:yes stop_codon:yes gene_type:complete
MGNIKDEDWVYLETFFNGLAEAREDLKGQIPDLTYRSLGEFTQVYSNYTEQIDKLKSQDINPYDFSKLNELEGLHIAVVNLYENALEYVIERIGETKMMEYMHEKALDISFMDKDEFDTWQEANKWVDTMKKSHEKIIAAAELLIAEGGRNEKEKKDIEAMKIALQYNDIESVKTLIQSFPQGMEFKSEGWFNTLKNAGAVTTTSAGTSALTNVAYGKPKNKHEQMKDEEKEFPIVVEDDDFWRD